MVFCTFGRIVFLRFSFSCCVYNVRKSWGDFSLQLGAWFHAGMTVDCNVGGPSPALSSLYPHTRILLWKRITVVMRMPQPIWFQFWTLGSADSLRAACCGSMVQWTFNHHFWDNMLVFGCDYCSVCDVGHPLLNFFFV